MNKLLKKLSFAFCAAVGIAAITTSARAHWDLPSCYVEVHAGCYLDTIQCTDEDYEGFLQECNDNYDESVGVYNPGASGSLASSSTSNKKRITVKEALKKNKSFYRKSAGSN